MLQTNETCENRLTESWNLTGLWNFSLPVGILCEIDDVANEWITYDLMVNVIDIVSQCAYFFYNHLLFTFFSILQLDTASINGEYAWNYDDYEIIVKNSTAIAQMIMELSEKTINFEEEELFLDVMMEFQELGLAIQQFIDQYDYMFLFFCTYTFSLIGNIILGE